MKKFLRFAFFFIALIMAVTFAKAQQSHFGRLKPPAGIEAVKGHLMLADKAAAAIDTVFTGWRIQGPSIVYTVPGNGAMAGVGFGYEHNTFNSSTGRWYTNWSVSPTIYAGGNVAPTSINAIAALGVQATFFNRYLTLGGAYNFVTKQPVAVLGISFDLFNN